MTITGPSHVYIEKHPDSPPIPMEDAALAQQQQNIATTQANQSAAQFATSLLVAEETRDRLPATGAASEITLAGVFGQVSELNGKFPEPQPTQGTGRAIPVSMLEGPQVGAAGAIRVSSARAVLDAKNIYDATPILWDDQQVSGAGTSSTHSTATASVTLSVSNLTAGKRVRQTKRRMTYQAGKGQLIQFTAVLHPSGHDTNPTPGIIRNVGQHDDNNGVFFSSRGVTGGAYTTQEVYVVVRSSTSGSPADSAYPQSQWKLDRMDGLGGSGNPSGIKVDWTKGQLFVIDYQWLSLGQIRFGLKIGTRIHYVHSVESENVISVPWASTPHLPMRCSIENDGTGPAATLIQICAAVFTEDGVDEIGYGFSVERTTQLVTNNDAALYPLIAMRLKSTHLGSTVRPLSISIVCATNAVFRWALLVDPTVVGTAFSWTPMQYTSVEVDISRTNTTTLTVPANVPSIIGGIAQQRDEGSLSRQTTTAYSIGATIAGVSEVLVLAVQRLDGAAETFYGSLEWRDFQ